MTTILRLLNQQLAMMTLWFLLAMPLSNVLAGSTHDLTTQNSAGRSGAYFVPSKKPETGLPLMLVFHGTGGNGQDMVTAFEQLAEQEGFLIVAPDSRVSPDGQFTWQVGSANGEITEDFVHALTCLEEVVTLHSVDPSFMLAAGYSGGGSSAPYLATNLEDVFTHFAVLHGGIVLGGIGDNYIPGWFSTGTDDNLRPPARVEQDKNFMQTIGYDVTYTVYQGGHELGGKEKQELVAWWLNREVAPVAPDSAANGAADDGDGDAGVGLPNRYVLSLFLAAAALIANIV